MRINFRSFVLASAAIAATAIATVPAHAATMGSANLNVPFSFNIDGKTMPAGEYKLLPGNIGSVVRLQGKNSATSFSALTAPGKENGQVILRFEVKNGTHVLESIRYGASGTPNLEAPEKNPPTANSGSAGQ